MSELYERIWAFVRRRVSSEAEADDLTQQVFERMLARADQLDDVARMRSWAFAIARNAVIDHHRGRTPEPLEHEPAQPAGDDDEGLDLAVASWLRAELPELPEPYREALELTDLGGLSQQEAARKLGLSPSGMRSRVQRGRKMLRTRLEQCCRVELDRRKGLVDCEPKAGGSCC